MELSEIVRRLVNSGVRVLGTDSTNIYIEDPGCILRGFESFIGYAWTIICVIAGFALLAWALALIRGVATPIATNLRNLVIIFGVLALVKPIVNTIWQGDLFGRGCRTIAVPISSVNSILDARNTKLTDDDRLFESFDIYDSGPSSDWSDADDFSPIVIPRELTSGARPNAGGDSAANNGAPAKDATDNQDASSEAWVSDTTEADIEAAPDAGATF